MSISVGDCLKFTNVKRSRSLWVVPFPGRGGPELCKNGDMELSKESCEHVGIHVSLLLTVDMT